MARFADISSLWAKYACRIDAPICGKIDQLRVFMQYRKEDFKQIGKCICIIGEGGEEHDRVSICHFHSDSRSD